MCAVLSVLRFLEFQNQKKNINDDIFHDLHEETQQGRFFYDAFTVKFTIICIFVWYHEIDLYKLFTKKGFESEIESTKIGQTTKMRILRIKMMKNFMNNKFCQFFSNFINNKFCQFFFFCNLQIFRAFTN